MAAPEAPLFYQGVPRTSAAFRLLKQMGWEEGEGLGKEKQGISEHIRVSKKKDNAGLGIDAKQKAASNWTFNTTVFDSILKNLKVIASDSDEGKNGGKQEEPVEMQEEFILDDSNKIQSHIKKVTRPQGRYKKRELGKVMQGRSQADLNAILGYGSKAKDGALDTGNCLDGSVSGESSEVHSEFGAPSDRLAEEKNATCTVKAMDSFQEVHTGNFRLDWWGTKHGFVRAGLLGASMKGRKEMGTKTNELGDEEVRPDNRTAFCEQDQENLYRIVQDKATKGRQGLGIVGRLKKIGGAHWKGQKKNLESSEDDDAQNGEAMDVQDGKIIDLDSVCNEKKHKRDTFAAHDLEGRHLKKSKKTRKGDVRINQKWKRLCEQILQEVPNQTMSIKCLHKRIVEACDLSPSNDSCDIEQAVLSFKEKLNRSSKFVVKGKKVSLAKFTASLDLTSRSKQLLICGSL